MKWKNLEYFEERAREADAEIVPVYSEDDAEFAKEIRDASAVVVIGRKIPAAMIEDLVRCEIILALSVGYDCVDLAAATRKMIPVSNVPAYCTDDVASHAMTLLTAVSRKLPLLISETKHRRWDYNIAKPVYTFKEKVLGIIGLGKIGRALVPKARGFGMKVAAYDPYLDDDIFRILEVERRYDIDDLLKEADYISIHTPLTPETHNLIDRNALSLMKNNAVLVNTARGEIVDESALYESLQNRGIAGAGVDVMSPEPPEEGNRLLELENLIVTPHIAWYSEESLARVKVLGMDEVAGVLNGRRPRYIVNPEIFGILNTR